MKEAELRQHIVELLEASNHPEIAAVSTAPDRGPEGRAKVHVKYTDGAGNTLYVRTPKNGDYDA